MNKSIHNHGRKMSWVKVFVISILWVVSQVAVGQIVIEAEDYDAMEGIQTEQTMDEGGGVNVGWIDAGDWLSYEVEIPVEGEYSLSVRYASPNTGGSLSMLVDGDTIVVFSFPSTGGWQEWMTHDVTNLLLARGAQTIRFGINSGEFNLNRFELKLTAPSDTDAPSNPQILSSEADVHAVHLVWTQSTDPSSAVAGYRILSGQKILGYTTEASYKLDKLAPQTSYLLSIVAMDIAGNASDTAKLSVVTQPIPWELMWSDEFEEDEVDRDKWNFQVGGGGWGNGESQYYTDGNNSRQENGHLIIEARQETIGGNDYTSSRMNTANKGDFLYGRIEVRAKLPSTGGTWPAIWTLPTDWIYGSWPDVGEIDIMEHSATYGLNYVFATIHTKAFNHLDGTQFSGGKTFEDVVNTFHTYTLEWYPDRLDWYYDDEHVFTYENPYQSIDEWPFDIPHHLLLNVAIGGGLGGDIDHDGTWPQQMIVDYVRMYDFDLGIGDTLAPSEPLNLTGIVRGTSVDLSWDISSDDQFVKKYDILLDGMVIDSVSGSSYALQCLSPASSVNIGVQARDFGGNKSQAASITITTENTSGISVASRFEAEDFACVEGIETETCTDAGGGLNLAFIDVGDWVEYYIDVPEGNTYYLFARMASLENEGSFDLEDEDGNILASVVAPATGGWQNWKSVVSDGFELSEGVQKIRLRMTANGFNINWLEFDTEVITSVQPEVSESITIFPNPVLNGQVQIKASQDSKGPLDLMIYSIDGKINSHQRLNLTGTKSTTLDLALAPGVYYLQMTLPNGRKSQKKLIIK